jgi:hypothetical protein
MSYSCTDFADSVLDALGVDCDGIEDDPSEQADAALEAIGKLRRSQAALRAALEKAAWFIENVNEDTPNRSELFFETREAWRNAFAAVED